MEQNTSRDSFTGTGEHGGKYLVETTETNSNILAPGTETTRITPDDLGANDETFPKSHLCKYETLLQWPRERKS